MSDPTTHPARESGIPAFVRRHPGWSCWKGISGAYFARRTYQGSVVSAAGLDELAAEVEASDAARYEADNQSSLAIGQPADRWRLLVLLPGGTDPIWCVVEVPSPDHITPAKVGPDGRYEDWQAATAWVREVTGTDDVSMVPMASALAWRIDEGGPR